MNAKKGPYVVCLSNEDFRASLIVRKIYRSLRDPAVEKRGLIRVIDESGEDYLFPAALFAPIRIPEALEKRLAKAS
ncbi:MAG TPA: hypothetical protein VFI25_12500 [Planctomycetota bacterium]|jgi:hypothetical protein|nr:hypothetical protein [Planctomycetota bacterium]